MRRGGADAVVPLPDEAPPPPPPQEVSNMAADNRVSPRFTPRRVAVSAEAKRPRRFRNAYAMIPLSLSGFLDPMEISHTRRRMSEQDRQTAEARTREAETRQRAADSREAIAD